MTVVRSNLLKKPTLYELQMYAVGIWPVERATTALISISYPFAMDKGALDLRAAGPRLDSGYVWRWMLAHIDGVRGSPRHSTSYGSGRSGERVVLVEASI